METGCCGAQPLRVLEALRALSAVMQRPGAPPVTWFKESSRRNLRSRDFLVPKGALRKIYPDGKVPEDLIQRLSSLRAPGVPPVQKCLQDEAGLVIQLDRAFVFRAVLSDISPYLKPAPMEPLEREADVVILNCAPLHSCEGLGMFRLSHLRAVLLADHLAETLRMRGQQVHLLPALHNKEILDFLQHLQVSWPSIPDAAPAEEAVSRFQKYLKLCPCAGDAPPKELPPSVLFNIRLKLCAEQQKICLKGYDPNLDTFHVSRTDLLQVAALQRCHRESVDGVSCAVLHVVSCEDEFHQQKLDLLWRILDPGAASQKHLICGPVKVLNPPGPVSCSQYFHVRRSQMQEASVMKYGESVKGSSWTEIIDSLTSAAVRFEMMSTPHRSQVRLDLEDSNITTKGTKSGAFVMYNCARLATMFESYNNAVTEGFYPAFPPPREINYSTLTEEGEWLLLFNYIMTFPEVLQQSVRVSVASPGVRFTGNTEAVCKFLVNLSVDFSSYYNRVHILGEPLQHLYQQMFGRLQLMRAVQSVLHSALESLHIRPPAQI
uniref:DALR anticodon binding domain containing 3 n=1 Tax=Leptobrachium leishanense TaxID=445787 RepID=A0A8C5MQ21_9ANUR